MCARKLNCLNGTPSTMRLHPYSKKVVVPRKHSIFVRTYACVPGGILCLLRGGNCALSGLACFVNRRTGVHVVSGVTGRLGLPRRGFLRGVRRLKGANSMDSTLMCTRGSRDFGGNSLITVAIFNNNCSAKTYLVGY